MSVPLFRTSILRSTQFLNGALRKVSRTLGTVNGKLLVRAPVVLPSHSELVRSRNFTTTSAATAAAATAGKTKSAKKPTTAKGRTVAKKKTTKLAASKKKLADKKNVVAKKKLAKAKAEKAKKAKAPRVLKKDWTPPFKRPLGPWAKFVIDFSKTRTSDQPISFKDHLRAASLEWKDMSEDQKAAYATPDSEFEEYKSKLAEWNSGLSKPLQLAKRKHRKSRRRSSSLLPLTPFAYFVKEQYHQVNYPADVTTTPQKMTYLSRIYANDLSEADKAGLKERSWEEFTKKNAASS